MIPALQNLLGTDPHFNNALPQPFTPIFTMFCQMACVYVFLLPFFLPEVFALQNLWCKKELVWDPEVASAKMLCKSIAVCWHKYGWEPTPWVHWTVYFLTKYRT